MINNPVITTAHSKNLELTLYIFATKKCGIPSQVGFAWRHALWRKMSVLLSLRRPALCDRPASLGSFKWGTRWIHMGDTEKHTGISQPQKKTGKWELTKLTTTTRDMNWQRSSQLCCFKMSCTGRPAGPGLLAAARPHNSSYLQCMSLLWFSLHERPSLLLRYLQISNSSSSPADDD